MTPRTGAIGGRRDEPGQVWAVLVPRVVHPVKVAVIEALLWMDRPLSSIELVQLFDCEDHYLSLVAYHVRKLAELGVIKPVESRQVRGSTETFYSFSEH